MERKLYGLMDSLSAEEAAEFDSTFEKICKNAVIAKPQQQRINSAVLKKFENGMSTEKNSMTKRKFKIKYFIIIAAALMIIGVIAAAAYPRLARFRGSYFESDLYNTVETVSNGDVSLTVDGVIADEVKCRVLVTVKAETKSGRAVIEDLTYMSDGSYEKDMEKLHKKLGDDAELDELIAAGYRHHDLGLHFENAGHSSFKNIFSDDTTSERMLSAYDSGYLKASDKDHFYTEFTLEMTQLDVNEPLILTECRTGLSISMDIRPFIRSVGLRSDSGFENAVISPLAVYVTPTDEELADCKFFDDGGYWGNMPDNTVTVVYLNGKKLELYGELSTDRYFEDNADYENQWNESIYSQQMVAENYDGYIDVDNVLYVIIDSTKYYPVS